MQRPLPSTADEVPPLTLDQRGRRFWIAAREVVPKGLTGEPTGLEPTGGPTMPLLDTLGRLESQPFREEWVVAVPLTPVVERQHEQVEPLEFDQLLVRTALPGDRFTQRAMETVEDRGLEQERSNVVRDA